MSKKYKLKLRIKAYMEKHGGITAYKMGQLLGEPATKQAFYHWLNSESNNISLNIAEAFDELEAKDDR